MFSKKIYFTPDKINRDALKFRSNFFTWLQFLKLHKICPDPDYRGMLDLRKLALFVNDNIGSKIL